jgi:hypothetical protein
MTEIVTVFFMFTMAISLPEGLGQRLAGVAGPHEQHLLRCLRLSSIWLSFFSLFFWRSIVTVSSFFFSTARTARGDTVSGCHRRSRSIRRRHDARKHMRVCRVR